MINPISEPGKNILKPSNKSYAGIVMDIKFENVEKIRNKENLLFSEKRALLHEFSDIEPIKNFIILTNKNKKLGRITTFQIKEIFGDMGFNINPAFGGKHYADFDAVMNINGYSIPGWVKIARIISKKFPSQEKNLLRKISPGTDRLHLRFFESNDGSWLIAAHTDHNWLSLNLIKTYKSHVGYGFGDYITGTLMLYSLLQDFAKTIIDNKNFTEKNIKRDLNSAYNLSLSEKLNLGSLKEFAIL